MGSLEEMGKRLASMQEQKKTAEKTSDTEFANELSNEIAILIMQMDSLTESQPTPLPEPTTRVSIPNENIEKEREKIRKILEN